MKLTKLFKTSDSGKLQRGRYELIDFLKGIMIISVVLYHFAWDLADIAGFKAVENFLGTNLAWYWQQISCGTFIFLSGVCCHFSRNNLKNGARVLAFGVIITIVTFIAEMVMRNFGFSGIFIWFGILHFIGCACLLMGLCQKAFDKVPSKLGAPLGLLLYLLTRGVYIATEKIPAGYIGFTFGAHEAERIRLLQLPHTLYTLSGMEWLGFPTAHFSSSDYFPLIPWIFLFLSGYYFWNLIKDTKFREKTNRFGIGFINKIGRNTIWVYLIHQPVLVAITAVIALAAGKL
ncbi:MAG: DUF1624 domain-containing protein [Ruminococcaceae bacterium]|nr:DUF1624 domain-containing protein [Oscillospiraceae bacterium]